MHMTRRTALLTALLVGMAALVPACGDKAPHAPVKMRLATTTSTENSGLLKFLLEPWQAETGIEVQVIPVGTGQALELGKRGDADLVLVHDRAREDAYVADGHATERRDVMWNDFVLLGPAADPAQVKQASGIADAL
ncbi:MAG: substrate-binding domain-containing protein, partial [Myxococcales bacterium]|nr:substrate-binding domain-containing protein [Myxococcales bacterium]